MSFYTVCQAKNLLAMKSLPTSLLLKSKTTEFSTLTQMPLKCKSEFWTTDLPGTWPHTTISTSLLTTTLYSLRLLSSTQAPTCKWSSWTLVPKVDQFCKMVVSSWCKIVALTKTTGEAWATLWMKLIATATELQSLLLTTFNSSINQKLSLFKESFSSELMRPYSNSTLLIKPSLT